MIYEFAVDPAIVATWCQRGLGSLFADHFGLGTPRIISQFPRSWEKLVWNEYRQLGHHRNRNRSLLMEQILKRVSDTTVRRTTRHWDNSKSWLENTELQHQIAPFDAILSSSNPRAHTHVICANSTLFDNPLWRRNKDKLVPRSPQETENVISPMLRIATNILFIDPFFCTESRYLKPFERCFDTIVKQRSGDRHQAISGSVLPSIEILRSYRANDYCKSELSRILPAQLNLLIRTLRPYPKGQRLHNRYILTDVGGLDFGDGLGVGGSDARDNLDDVVLQGKDRYRKRWEQYADGAHAFRVVDQESICGRVQRR